MLRLELDYNLRYKELTHHQSVGRGIFSRNQHGWTDKTSYRWNKRRMAKLSRRNARVIIAEYDASDFDPGDAIGRSVYRIGNLTGDMVEVIEYERAVVFDYWHGANCHICGKEGGH